MVVFYGLILLDIIGLFDSLNNLVMVWIEPDNSTDLHLDNSTDLHLDNSTDLTDEESDFSEILPNNSSDIDYDLEYEANSKFAKIAMFAGNIIKEN